MYSCARSDRLRSSKVSRSCPVGVLASGLHHPRALFLGRTSARDASGPPEPGEAEGRGRVSTPRTRGCSRWRTVTRKVRPNPRTRASSPPPPARLQIKSNDKVPTHASRLLPRPHPISQAAAATFASRCDADRSTPARSSSAPRASCAWPTRPPPSSTPSPATRRRSRSITPSGRTTRRPRTRRSRPSRTSSTAWARTSWRTRGAGTTCACSPTDRRAAVSRIPWWAAATPPRRASCPRRAARSSRGLTKPADKRPRWR